jgi:metal-responsive CopG/Arc/MetJ family transcriptional regulator
MRIIYTDKIQMKRLNITLPDDIANELDSITNKSRYISAALKEKMEKEKKQKLDVLLCEGYQTTKEEDEALDKDWEKATLEGWDKTRT